MKKGRERYASDFDLHPMADESIPANLRTCIDLLGASLKEPSSAESQERNANI